MTSSSDSSSRITSEISLLGTQLSGHETTARLALREARDAALRLNDLDTYERMKEALRALDGKQVK